MRLQTVLLVVGVGVVAGASALLVRMITRYIDRPLALDSTSGHIVFHLEDGYAQYPPLRLGLEVPIAGAGLLVVLVALAIGAATYRAGSEKP